MKNEFKSTYHLGFKEKKEIFAACFFEHKLKRGLCLFFIILFLFVTSLMWGSVFEMLSQVETVTDFVAAFPVTFAVFGFPLWITVMIGALSLSNAFVKKNYFGRNKKFAYEIELKDGRLEYYVKEDGASSRSFLTNAQLNKVDCAVETKNYLILLKDDGAYHVWYAFEKKSLEGGMPVELVKYLKENNVKIKDKRIFKAK